MKTCSTPAGSRTNRPTACSCKQNPTKDDTDNGNGRNEIAENFPQCMCIAQHMLGNGRNEIAEIFPQCMHT